MSTFNLSEAKPFLQVSSGDIVLLPDVRLSEEGFEVTVYASGSGSVTVTPFGNQTVGGVAGNYTLTAPGLVRVAGNGVTGWLVTSLGSSGSGEDARLPDPATGSDGDVVTVDAEGNYELVAPAGGGGGSRPLETLNLNDADLIITETDRDYQILVGFSSISDDRSITLPAADATNLGQRITVNTIEIPEYSPLVLFIEGFDVFTGQIMTVACTRFDSNEGVGSPDYLYAWEVVERTQLVDEFVQATNTTVSHDKPNGIVTIATLDGVSVNGGIFVDVFFQKFNGDVTTELPSGKPAGTLYLLIRTYSGGSGVTVNAPSGGGVVNGGASVTLTTQWKHYYAVTDGTDWFVNV